MLMKGFIQNALCKHLRLLELDQIVSYIGGDFDYYIDFISSRNESSLWYFYSIHWWSLRSGGGEVLLAYDILTGGFIAKVACSYIGEMPSESRQVIRAYVFQCFLVGSRSGVIF